jgi:hypothetical protein
VTDCRDAERRRDQSSFEGRIEDEPRRQRAAGDESGRREDDDGQELSKEEERSFDEVAGFDQSGLRVDDDSVCHKARGIVNRGVYCSEERAAALPDPDPPN